MKNIEKKRSHLRSTNIFKHSIRKGYGHSNIDEIAYFTEFPRYKRPYNVLLTKDDHDSFPFVMAKVSDNMLVLIGEHGDTYESLLSDKGIKDEEIMLKGRGWKDSQCIVIDQKSMSIEELLILEAALRQSLHIDISKWYVFKNGVEAVNPEEINRRETSKLVKHIQKLIKFLDRILKSETTFTDFTSSSSDEFFHERIFDDITSSLMDYEFLYSYGKIEHEQEEYLKVTKQLRDCYQLLDRQLHTNINI